MSKVIKKVPKRGEMQKYSQMQSIPRRGEIWLIDYNYKPKKDKERELEIESYIKKIRPSLVVSNDIQNEFDEEIIVVPLTSQEIDKIEPYELLVRKNKENGLEVDSKILFNRLRNIEKVSRLGDYKIGVVDKKNMKEVTEKLKLVLELE